MNDRLFGPKLTVGMRTNVREGVAAWLRLSSLIAVWRVSTSNDPWNMSLWLKVV